MRQKTIRAFDEWKADPLNWSMVVQRVAGGETLKEICEGQKQPYSLVAKHLASTPALNAEYEAARRIWADSLAQETVGIADAVEGADEAAHVSAAKLRVDTRLKLAGKLDRERYGEQEGPRIAVNINLGDMAREIRELEGRLGLGPVVLEQKKLPPAEPEVQEI